MIPPLTALHIHASCANLGDWIIVDNLRRELRRRFQEDIRFFSSTRQPEGSALDSGFVPKSILTAGKPFRQAWSAVCHSDFVLVGGGDLLTGLSNFRLYRNLIAVRLPVFFVGVGVNVNNLPYRMRAPLLKTVMGARHIITRDPESYAQLRSLGFKALTDGVDLAVLSFDERTSRRPSGAFGPGLGPRIGVSVREPEGNTYRWGEREYRSLASALDSLIQVRAAEVTFLEMVSPPGEESRNAHAGDRRAIEEVRRWMRFRTSTRVASPRRSLPELFGFFQQFDVIFGMRLHALMLASMAGTPVVPLDYSPKIRNWWNRVRGPCQDPEREAIPASDWDEPARLCAAVLFGLRPRPAEAEAIARELRRQQERAGAALDRIAAELIHITRCSGNTGFGRRARFLTSTRVVEPLRNCLERLELRMQHRLPGT